MDEKARMRLRKATQDFEALFVAHMLKSMRNTIPQGGMFGEKDGLGNDMLQGLFDMELSRQMARGRSLGLGDMLYQEITGQKSPPTTRHSSAPVLPPPPRSPQTTTAAARKSTDPVRPAPVHGDPSPTPGIRVGHTVAERVNTFTPFIREAAEKHGVDTNLLKAVIATESAGNPGARSTKEAKGLMQLIDSTATAMGVADVWNPRDNILGGARYLQGLLSRFAGNIEKALASYNAGPAAVEKHGGIPPYRETRVYVGRVMRYLQFFEQQEAPGHEED